MTPPMKNARGVFITGTDTGVGKTIVTAAIAVALQSLGLKAGVMKPIVTGLGEGETGPSDPDWLVSTLNSHDAPDLVSPYRFELGASPLVAANSDQTTIDLNRIVQAFQVLSTKHDLVVVEGIGGILVPITEDLFVVDLIKRMAIPAIVVARDTLGSINHTLLTLECLRSRGVPILGLIFNSPGGPASSHDKSETVATILRFSGVRSFGELPYCDGLPDAWDIHRDRLMGHLDMQGLLEALGLRGVA